MTMLSATVRSGISDSSWKMQTMPAAIGRGRVEAKLTSRPSSIMRPSSGATTPAMILIRVDLPAPFSPRMAWMRPAWTVRLGLLQRPDAAIALGDAFHAKERPRCVHRSSPGICRQRRGDSPAAPRSSGTLISLLVLLRSGP